MPAVKQAALGLLLAAAAILPARAMTYGECTALIDKAPGDAYSAAVAWIKTTDDPAAQHCAALAEVALKRYGAAGDRLNRMIDQTENPYEAAALLGQLGNVRMLDGKPDLAIKAFDLAVKNTPNDPQLLADRARAYAAQKNWPMAVRDLDGAVQIDDEDPELHLLYATALREAGKLPEALGAIEKAASLAPGDAAILLERGRIHLLRDERDKAAADWKQAAAKATDPAIRDAANASLKALTKK
ncbi:tetratricopeptide repeat protein [Zavarzinia aquatilis]|nr:tetratricopeptide repeat protein [Zavarzinia aquatilis]